MKTEIVRVPLEPEEKEQLRLWSFQTRTPQAELLRRAWAFFLASESSVSNQDAQEVEGAPA